MNLIVAGNVGTKKDNHLLNVVFVTDDEGLLVSFRVVASPDGVT